ncbi:MAG: ParB/RepB/Spo0J family partition protein [Oscillospiraceae bacterium]|nr:ParB/RepB/Spo0J family partition protein [Oscillospiraceae bacterium]
MANQAKGLGRGLGALLGDAALESSVAEQTHTLPLSQIETCASQPRKRFDEEALADLADSIREHGIIQPITVRKLASGYYQIIVGERRWRAARMAGLSEVPVVIIEADDRKAMELAMIENLQREDLNPMEEAEGYHALMESYNLTQEEAAERVGKSRSAVANVMRLLHLCAPVRKLVEEGQLSAGHARTLIPLSPDMQEKLAETIIKNDLSVRQTEALVKKFGKEPKKAPSPEEMLSVNYTEAAAHELTEHLGRSCRIVSGKKKGRLEIEYYGVDDLNDLLDALHTLRRKSGGKA